MQTTAKKLRLHTIKNQPILIINAPGFYLDNLSAEGFYVHQDPVPAMKGNYEFVQIFAEKQVELYTLMEQHRLSGKEDCLFWVCYPKGTAKLQSDIKRDVIWAAFNSHDLRLVTAISIDETWTAMRGRPSK